MQQMTPEQLVARIDSAVTDYTGLTSDLYMAVGVLAVGHKLGWRVLRLTLSSRCYARYQKILGVDFKEFFPEEGVLAGKSVGLKIVTHLNNFWNVVRGAEAIDATKKRTLESI
jgi:hypothetical protein